MNFDGRGEMNFDLFSEVRKVAMNDFKIVTTMSDDHGGRSVTYCVVWRQGGEELATDDYQNPVDALKDFMNAYYLIGEPKDPDFMDVGWEERGELDSRFLRLK